MRLKLTAGAIATALIVCAVLWADVDHDLRDWRTGDAWRPEDDADKPPVKTPTTYPAREVIKVATVKELVEAVKGSDRTIRLTAKEYKLEHPLHLTQRTNVRIEGAGEKPARLIMPKTWELVMKIRRCANVELENLVLGHDPAGGLCDEGVLTILRSSDVRMKNCELFGCGTFGLAMSHVWDFRATDCTIHDCDGDAILTMTRCRGAVFHRCTFRDNEGYQGIVFSESTGVHLVHCTIRGNKLPRGQGLFDATQKSKVELTGGKMENNTAGKLFYADDGSTLESAYVVQKNNKELGWAKDE